MGVMVCNWEIPWPGAKIQASLEILFIKFPKPLCNDWDANFRLVYSTYTRQGRQPSTSATYPPF